MTMSDDKDNRSLNGVLLARLDNVKSMYSLLKAVHIKDASGLFCILYSYRLLFKLTVPSSNKGLTFVSVLATYVFIVNSSWLLYTSVKKD